MVKCHDHDLVTWGWIHYDAATINNEDWQERQDALSLSKKDPDLPKVGLSIDRG